MKHISVIVPAGEAVLSSIIGTFKIFNAVNSYLMKTGMTKEPAFQVDLVGIQENTALYGGLFSIKPTKTIDQVEKTDVIIVTTVIGDFDKELKNNAAFVPWIIKQRVENNAEVASLCAGAFLLAETGLLNGKTATTHWSVVDEFRARYPQIEVLDNKVICENNGIYSSGGAYSFLNLILHLVEKYAGREVGIWASKMFEIEYDRDSQSEFTIFNGQKEHEDEPIKNAQKIIEKNIGEKITVEDLADKVALSRRNFIRRFKKATANTPLEYIQRVKMESAKKSLESSTGSVSETMYQVGYNDEKAFRNTFRKVTGLTPLDYRKKYNREMVMMSTC